MNKPKAPCLNCENRQVNCHSKCKAYKQFKYENDLYNKELQKERQEKDDWYGYKNIKYRNYVR